MDSYEILWKKSAEQDLRSIDRQQITHIINTVESLSSNPFPPQHRKLKGSEREYRIRVGDYRVIYQVDFTSNVIIIYHIRHRREVYRKK